MTEDLDALSTTKANLELLLLDNRSLLEHFSGLMSTLEAMAELPSEEKQERLNVLQSSGAFAFNGVDIRRFQHSAGHSLPPEEFLLRTRRRLNNTLTLLGELMKKNPFDAGASLQQDIQQIDESPVDPADTASVVAYRDRVEILRNSEPFLTYMDTKNAFLREDAGFKAEAEYAAAKEAVAEGEQTVHARQDELETIQQGIEDGELSPEKAQEKIDDLEPLEG